MAEKWKQYQYQTSELLRELGFATQVNDLIAGANGAVHEIDVSARRTLAGIDLLWVVECKHWNRAIPKEKVATLQAIASDIGADRGLLISERGFQPGAHEMARAKNITLCSTEYLRVNAAEELLAVQVTVAEERLMNLSLQVNKKFRPVQARNFARYLMAMAVGLRPEELDEFAKRPETTDFMEGAIEVSTLISGRLKREYLDSFLVRPSEESLPWKPGMDPKVMDGVAAMIDELTEALYRSRLGRWPVYVRDSHHAQKLAWSTRQLIDTVDPCLDMLEDKLAEQEAIASRLPRPEWK